MHRFILPSLIFSTCALAASALLTVGSAASATSSACMPTRRRIWRVRFCARVSHASAIVVGTIIGSGIFLVPADMMKAAGSARTVFLAWIVGGLFSFCGAVTYAQLGAMKPQAGGEYVYIRDAFGPLAGFLCAWTWTIVVKPTSLAGISTGIVRVLSNFPALSFLIVPDGHLTNRGKLVAIFFVGFVSCLNYIGIRRAGNFQLAFTALKVLVILAVAALGFLSLLGAELGVAQEPEHARLDPHERVARRLLHGRGELGLHGHLGRTADEGEQLLAHRALGQLLVMKRPPLPTEYLEGCL